MTRLRKEKKKESKKDKDEDAWFLIPCTLWSPANNQSVKAASPLSLHADGLYRKSKGRRPGASRQSSTSYPGLIPDRSRPISPAHHLSVGATAQSSEQLHSNL